MTGSPNLKPPASYGCPKRPSNGLPPKAKSAGPLASAPASGLRPSIVPEDLDRVKNAQTAQAVVMPPQAEAGGVPALGSRAGELSAFLQSLITGADVPLRDKLFLSVKEATRFSGLPETAIRRLLRSRKLPGVKTGGWRIKRSDLEQLDLRHLEDLSDKPVLNTEKKGVLR